MRILLLVFDCFGGLPEEEARAVRGPEHRHNDRKIVPGELDVRRDEILRVLKDANYRVAGPQGAAARIGIKRTTLISRMKKLGIEPRRAV